MCERYRFKPTYLTDFEMVMCPVYREFARDALRRQTAEVGMHLHAWNSPPLAPLTPDDFRNLPYLIEYPEDVMRDKVRFLTRLLEEHFGSIPVSHRAGRWAFNESYARILVDAGYKVDCSVAPNMSYRSYLGDPNGNGGTDYTGFPSDPYFVNLNNIRLHGESPLLELPVTVMNFQPSALMSISKNSLPGRIVNRLYPAQAWLRPNGNNLGTMLRIVHRAAHEELPCIEFMLHSSELMPGGSPTFPLERDIEKLYDHLEELFATIGRAFVGATLSEYYQYRENAVTRQRALCAGSGDLG